MKLALYQKYPHVRGYIISVFPKNTAGTIKMLARVNTHDALVFDIPDDACENAEQLFNVVLDLKQKKNYKALGNIVNHVTSSIIEPRYEPSILLAEAKFDMPVIIQEDKAVLEEIVVIDNEGEGEKDDTLYT